MGTSQGVSACFKKDQRSGRHTWLTIKCQHCSHIEISHLICYANQLTGFYMGATLTFNVLTSRTCPRAGSNVSAKGKKDIS